MGKESIDILLNIHSSEGSNGLIHIAMKYQRTQHVHGAFQKKVAQTMKPHVSVAILSTKSNHTTLTAFWSAWHVVMSCNQHYFMDKKSSKLKDNRNLIFPIDFLPFVLLKWLLFISAQGDPSYASLPSRHS